MDSTVAQALKTLTTRPGEAIIHFTNEELQLLDEMEKQDKKELDYINQILASVQEAVELQEKGKEINHNFLLLKMAKVLDRIRESRQGVTPSVEILRKRLTKERILAEEFCCMVKRHRLTDTLFMDLINLQMDYIKDMDEIRSKYYQDSHQLRQEIEG